jgi:hypothetical protein
MRDRKWSNRFDEGVRDLQLKQIMDNLETENNLLKALWSGFQKPSSGTSPPNAEAGRGMHR